MSALMAMGVATSQIWQALICFMELNRLWLILPTAQKEVPSLRREVALSAASLLARTRSLSRP